MGFDIPILFGWRSAAGVVTLTSGGRAGFETVSADAGTPAELSMRRLYGGAVFGLSMGFRHVRAALELDAYYQRVSGSLGDQDVQLSGVTVTPGAGLVLTF